MEIGTGIFLGCTVLAISFLFIKTRGVWNWKKIALWALTAPIVLAILILGFVTSVDAWHGRAKVITEFKGISLNEKFSDVLFNEGDFEQINDKDQTSGESDEKEYKNKIGSLRVTVLKGKVINLTYFCNEKIYDNSSVNGISCGDSGQEITDKFSSKMLVRCLKRGSENDKYVDSIRVFDTPTYGVRYVLIQNRVKGFFIAPEEKISFSKKWIECE